jgi:hypothetical protein
VDQIVPWQDALRRVELLDEPKKWDAERAIVTLVTPGYEALLDQLLSSLHSWGQCPDARRFVLLLDSNAKCESVMARHNAVALRCRRCAARNQGLKAALYSIATLIKARYFLCLDADTLVVGDLRPVFDALQALPSDRILVAGDAYLRPGSLGTQFTRHYEGRPEDWKRLLNQPENEAAYPFVVNDGVFAGSRQALLGIDGVLRSLPDAISWVDELPDHGWRNQFVFNLALARLNCAAKLDPAFNVQMHMNDVRWSDNCRTTPVATWQGRPAKVLHYCGWGRAKDESLRRAAAQVLPRVSGL